MTTSTPRWAAAATPILIAVGVLAVYVLRLDTAAGLVVDDAWYVVLAKALAQGDGFRLISSAVTQIMPVVPPGYPLILAPVFLISPAFPQNVFLLKSISIAAMMGVGAVVYIYLAKCRDVARPMAAVIATITVLLPAFVFLATSTLMAECVFTLGQVLTVWWLDAAAQVEPSKQRRTALAAGVLAAGAMLVRTAGVATLLAGVVFLLKERGYRPAAAFLLASALCLAPWTLYSYLHAPTAAEAEAHGGTIAFAYGGAMGLRQPGNPNLGTVGPREFAERLGRNVVNVFGRDLGGIFVPAFFRSAEESGEEIVSLAGPTGFIGSSMGGSPVTMTITLVLSAIVLAGFTVTAIRRVTAAEIVVVLSLAMIVTVPTSTFRYVLPLTPYLLLYFWAGLEATTRSKSAARLAVLCVLGLQLQDHVSYIAIKLRDPARLDWLRDARAAEDLTAWMNTHLEDDRPVASTNPGLVYLLTGRKTVATDEFDRAWPRWEALGIRYVVALRPLTPPSSVLDNRLLYRSDHRLFWVVKIGGS